ncbi:MAG: RNA polymerase sigma factor, partial [Planctomycetota bacterium]
ILRIATNLCRNRFAARRRSKERRPAGGEDDPPEEPVTETPPRLDPRERGRVRRAIEALPERYRLAVVLHYIQGLPLDAISEITGAPVPTVKTHLHRGRAALRDLLAPPETSGDERGTTD